MKLTKEELDIIEGLKKNKDNFLIELGQNTMKFYSTKEMKML